MGKMQMVTDRRFIEIKEKIAALNKIELIKLIGTNYIQWVEQTPKEVVEYVVAFHNRYQFWGDFNPKTGNIELIIKRADFLKDRWESIEKFYYRLEDYRSKQVLLMILDNWLTFSYEEIEKVEEKCFKAYFDMDLLQCDENEIFVDLGAYQGDTIEDYFYTYGEDCHKKIYCYEIVQDNVEILKEKFGSNDNIVIRPVGVSKEEGIMYLSDNGTVNGQFLVSTGEKEVKTVSLDNDIAEKITFLKSDIEGGEQDAILGAREHIRNDRPKLAISIYHSNEDLVEIFELIESIQPGYRFYLRYNGLPYFPTDYTLIGLPPQ